MEFQVAKRSEIKKIVEKVFHKTKSAGYKTLHKRTADDYAGLSKRQVLKCASTNEKIRKISVKFNNKAQPRPVIVKRIHEQQHQVDLVDMKGMEVKYKGKHIGTFCHLRIYCGGFIVWLPVKERRVVLERKN